MPTLAEQIIPRRKLLLIGSETVIFSGLLLLGTSLPPLASRPVDFSQPWSEDLLRGALSCFTIAILCQACLSYNDLYDWKVSQNRAELPHRLMHSAGYALVMLAMVVFFLPWLFHFPGLANVGAETWKLIFLLALGFLAVYAWRFGFHWFFYKWNFGERVVVLGAGAQARSIAEMIHDRPVAGFEVFGLVGTPPPGAAPSAGGGPVPQHHRVLGPDTQLAQICREERISRVVVALEERRGQLPVAELLECRMQGVVVEEREAMYERIAGKIAIESLRPSYLIFGHGFGYRRGAAALKRAIDIVASAVGLLLASPIVALVVVLIRLDSRGPIFFRQPRVGQDGVTFDVLKFRTMRADAERHTGPVWARPNDDRVTRVGRLLRLTRIDEIPQMLNVLLGQMSFVGPRPERPFFVRELSREVPFYPLRLTVKPGITGWAQVNHHYGASVDDAVEKLRYDLYYIKNMSPLFDLNILLRTVGVVLFGKGAR
ncbi:MAG: TIGR03013 family PEP-CTERM/XrtA system glycosyltransferase [Planctomycetes bacterium]|nr:TIGR03013 family PEP-CTERM/XrtA system glycosyltransferase [Planctomycetota bacterium]